jgi:hypothetical protein
LKTAITINGQTVTISATWEELTLKQAIALNIAKTDAEVLASVSDIDADTCAKINPQQLAAIIWPINAMGELPTSDEWSLPLTKPKALGSMEFARKVNVDGLARLKLEPIEVLGRVVAIYCATGIEDTDIESCYSDVLNMPFPSVADAGRYLTNQLAEISKMEAAIKTPDYESEEWQAGISDFKKYGTFGLVRGIALRHHCSDEDVYRWSYNKVVLELQYAADENAYQRKLNKILSNKNKKK